MKQSEFRALCVELQSRGVRIYAQQSGRMGGAGPAEGRTIAISGRHLTVPASSWYVARSPFHISSLNGRWQLFKNDESVCEISLGDQPRFYTQRTAQGAYLKQIALLHGKDCLASTVFQGCDFWGTPRQCKFCGIGISLEQNATVLRKSPEDLAIAAESAERHDGATHVTLTSGAWGDDQEGLSHMCACIRAISRRSGLPVHVQVHLPRCHGDLIILREAGAETIGLHIEVPTPGLLAEIAPAKADRGIDDYIHFWRSAVTLFGRNQVSSFLIAGCGETAEELLEMAETMAVLGVFPYVLPLRPIPQTPLADRQPPDPGSMIDLYSKVSRILERHGLSSSASKAGCVRCGACSCLSLFEDR